MAKQVTVLQRTPNWIMPSSRVTYSDSKRKLFNLVPPYLRITQKVQRALMGMIEQASTLGHKRMDQFENRVLGFIKKAIDDPKTQAAVTPQSRYACNLGLASDGLSPSLNAQHVELVAAGFTDVRCHSIVR